MIAAEDFCAGLTDQGFTLATGVPCSSFGGPIALLGARGDAYVPAANEGAALAIAAGAVLAGGRPYVMLQNSGLGNLVNPLTSLVQTYGLPVLTFVSLRGWPDPSTDEPQHEVMGPATRAVLEALGAPCQILRADCTDDGFREILANAAKELDARRAPFVLVERGAIGKAEPPAAGQDAGLSSAEAIRIVAETAPTAALIATTGYTGRELFAVADRPGNFYMQGSMGHASAIGLGVALTRPRQPVIVLDGDGALLMHLGTLSTIGHEAPPNLLHVVLDNQVHESTGGQCTTSSTTSFSGAATAAGYRTAVDCRTQNEVRAAVADAIAAPGPHFCAVRVGRRTGVIPPRATSAASAMDLGDRFATTLAQG
ncbi:phosphonopyruvate decarboxylase [Actinomadura macra]|uniref:phosphonopyruvate decarboxylase n=1 Tax=Actinomadura macra TaxID=46164 RepID=UPI000833FA31|nr:phosphonopyruvate decarboxylase [Actinomadura macra]